MRLIQNTFFEVHVSSVDITEDTCYRCSRDDYNNRAATTAVIATIQPGSRDPAGRFTIRTAQNRKEG